MARPSKVWYWQARDGWYATIAGKRHHLAKGKANKAEAQKAFHRMMAGLDPAATAADAPAFALVADLFLEHSTRENAAATTEQYRIKLQSACDQFGGVTAADLKPSHLSKWIAAHAWGDVTRRGAITAVKIALASAAREGLLAANPLAHITRPRIPRRERTLTAEERSRIAESVHGPFGDSVVPKSVARTGV